MGSARINRYYELHQVCVPATTKNTRLHTPTTKSYHSFLRLCSVSHLRLGVIHRGCTGVVWGCGNILLPRRRTVRRGWCGLHYCNGSGSWGRPRRQGRRVLTSVGMLGRQPSSGSVTYPLRLDRVLRLSRLSHASQIQLSTWAKTPRSRKMMSERKDAVATRHARTDGEKQNNNIPWCEGPVDHVLRAASGARRLKG